MFSIRRVATAVDFANITYTAANGVITFALVGAHSLGNVGNDYLYAAEAIVNQAPNQIAEFAYNGSTYVVASGAASGRFGPTVLAGNLNNAAQTALWNESISAVSGTNFNATTVLQFSGMTGPTGFATGIDASPPSASAPSVTTGIAIGSRRVQCDPRQCVQPTLPNGGGSVAGLVGSTWVTRHGRVGGGDL